MSKEDPAIFNSRFRQANESLEEAIIFKNEGMLNSSVLNSLYYAVFYSIMAALKKKNIGTLKHADIFSQFNREFIQNALIRPVAKNDDSDFSKLLEKMSEFHNSCECMKPAQVSDDEIKEVFPLVREFIADVGKLRDSHL